MSYMCAESQMPCKACLLFEKCFVVISGKKEIMWKPCYRLLMTYYNGEWGFCCWFFFLFGGGETENKDVGMHVFYFVIVILNVGDGCFF